MTEPTRDEVLGYFSSLSNWGRWGPDDRKGTLNLITPETVAAAARLARRGLRFSCARSIGPRTPGSEGSPPLHFMLSSGETAPDSGFGGATDWFGLAFHGHAVTHLDAPSHIFWDGKLYNGVDASRVTTSRGALDGSVELAADGAVGRGVLVDIPRHRGVPRLSERDPIAADELTACLRAQGTDVHPGDILVVRTGRDVASGDAEPSAAVRARPGLDASCLPWLRAHDVAMLVSDVAQEVQPSGYEGLPYPVHAVGIVAMGLWLVDNAYLEPLAAACAESRSYEFLLSVAPLRLKNATGSPVNPIAIL
jgi:kynurenine formamidase